MTNLLLLNGFQSSDTVPTSSKKKATVTRYGPRTQLPQRKGSKDWSTERNSLVTRDIYSGYLVVGQLEGS